MRKRFVPIFIVLVSLIAACVSTGANVPRSGDWMVERDAGAFVTTLGSDTIAFERFVLQGNTLDVDAVTRSPRTMTWQLRLNWDDEGRLTTYEATQSAPGAAAGEFTSRTGFVARGDSLVWSSTSGGQTRTMTRAAANQRAPFIPPLLSPYMVMARIALARGDATAHVASAGGGFDMQVSRPDRAWLAFTDPQLGTIRLRLDAGWRTQEIDATGSTLGSYARRLSDIDIAGWAREFAARDAAGRGVGMLSPPDTVRANVGGATVTIGYHRPFRRGRTIFPDVVRWGQVWRTGANQATAFATDRDLLIGGTHVPAGSYTIWSIPSQTGWQLILNRQTGQWGTQYNAEQDLAHIPMRVETLASPVEQFTIAITPRGNEHDLSFTWDTRRGVVDVRTP
jgi:hypothetical protein